MNCMWCSQPVTKDSDAVYGVSGVDGTLCCEQYVPGCGACEDGEAHPHEVRECEVTPLGS